jgi:diguanylate cyclase (GGDEF)-like protein/PAS domain S-box-containing protein
VPGKRGPAIPADAPQWRAVYEVVASRTHDAVMVTASTPDDDTIRVQFVNESFERLTGFGRDEIIGGVAGLLVGPDTDLDVLRDVQASLVAGSPASCELVLHRKDGTPFRVEADYERIDSDDGFTFYVSTYHDLARRAAAEAALWRSEEWTQALVSKVSDLLFVVDADTTIQWVAPSIRGRLGYEPEEVVGTRARDLMHPDDLAASMEEFGAIIENRHDYLAKVFRVRHQNGSWRSVSITSSNQLDHPAIRGVILTGTDVTQQTLDAEQMRRSERWAKALVQGGSDLVVVADYEGTVTYASPALEEVLGYLPEEFVGMKQTHLLRGDEADEGRDLISAAVNEGLLTDSYELRTQHKDGSWRILNFVMTNMLDDPAVEGLVFNIRDVTSRRVVEDLLSEQAELLEAIARGAPLEITLQKITQMIEHVMSEASCSIGIFDPDGSIRVRAAPSLPRQIVSLLDELAPDSEAGIELRRSGGEAITYDLTVDNGLGPASMFRSHGFSVCRAAPVLAPGSGELLGALSVFHPETAKLSRLEADLLDRALNLAAIAIERRRFESTLEYQALYDPLTGLPNRTLLHSRIEDALTRSGRLDTGVAVLFVDLDRFKVINDSVGHALGDQLLIEVTERFKEPLRPGDTLGRFGGDEFMIVCGRIADEAAAAEAAKSFMTQLEKPIKIDGGEIYVTASIGIAFDGEGTVSAESLIRNADVAMYRAKDQGRNQLVVFQERLDLQAVEQLALEQAIRHAIDNEEFELYFQPAVRLSDGAMTHVEALIRWHRPGKGLVFPGVFIPLAEETGLIVPLGWWVLEEACRQAVAWPRLPSGGEVEVAVNLSAKQLASPELIPIVSRVLQTSGLAPHRLCFEVTESALVHDVEQAKAALLHIKSLGVRLAIDDFGTGYASLDYVRHFSMADYLKIDRSFVEGVEKEGSQEAAIVTAAIALARSLGLTVIAEGVETLFQMEALRDLECDLAQGYLFSRPVPVDAAIELLCSQ